MGARLRDTAGAMSQGNVAIMRGAYDAFHRGEANVLFDLLDPGIEWQSLEDTEPRHGTEEVLESIGAWFHIWDDFQIEPEEFIDGGDHVVAVVMERGRVPGSSQVISQRFFQVWTLSDGKISAFREYKTQREALEAAGLSL